jgi:hypothetical protein
MRVPRCLAALAPLALPPLLLAQAAPAPALPPAESLVARYVAGLGGRDAVQRLPARWERGRVEVPSQGMTISYEMFAAPLRMAMSSEMAGLGTIRSGFDGEIAWTINPAMGPMILEGTAAQQLRQSTDPVAMLHASAYVASMQTVEAADFGGAPCYKVRVTTPWNEEYFEYFNRDTGLLQGGVRKQATPNGDIEITTVITEYRDVAGVKLPRVTRGQFMGIETVNTVDSTEVRAVPDSVFALPPQIRTLRAGH